MIGKHTALHAGYISGLSDHLRFSPELLRDRGISPNKIMAFFLLAAHSLAHPFMNLKVPALGVAACVAAYIIEPSITIIFAQAILSAPWYAQGIAAAVGMIAITAWANIEDKFINNRLRAWFALGKIQDAAWDGYEDGMNVKYYPKLIAKNLPKVSIAG